MSAAAYKDDDDDGLDESKKPKARAKGKNKSDRTSQVCVICENPDLGFHRAFNNMPHCHGCYRMQDRREWAIQDEEYKESERSLMRLDLPAHRLKLIRWCVEATPQENQKTREQLLADTKVFVLFARSYEF